MKPFQKLSQNGLQVCLFPLPRLHVTQGMNTTFTHFNSLAMDFIGFTPLAKMYAPCDIICVRSSLNGMVYNSLNPVLFADGTSDFFSILMYHDHNIYPLGRIVLQGEWFANTGTEGFSTGDHTHIEVKKGVWEGYVERVPGSSKMKNHIEPYKLFAVNDTIITDDGGYTWTTVQEGIPIWMM